MELHHHHHHGLAVVFLLIASCGYSYLLIPHLLKGGAINLRLVFLLPVFYVLTIFPWIFTSSIIHRLISSFLVTWLTSFKLILFCFDRGPLMAATTTNFLDFAFIAIFPIKLRETKHHHDSDHDHDHILIVDVKTWEVVVTNVFLLLSISWPLFTLAKTTFFPLNDEEKSFSSSSSSFVLTRVLLALILVLCSSFSIWLGRVVLGRYEVLPLLNRPHRSTLLRDFWDRRWNRLGSDVLRQTIYEPVQNVLIGRLAWISPGTARVMGTVTTLVVSGLVHELLFYYMTCGARPTWEVMWFFVLQGVCMAIESGLLGLVRARGWQIPVRPMVITGLTLGFVLVTGYCLLVLPTLRKGEGECRMNGLEVFWPHI